MTQRFWGRDDRGQALVELALVLTILLTLLLGTVEFGRIGHAYLTVLHASREGARVGALGYEDKDITARVRAAAASIPDEELSIQVLPDKGQRFIGEHIEVSVSHDVHLVVPFFSGILPDPFPVIGRTTMRIE
ncbi:MAG: pilus assembly protein [Firmicutes bacterium]|nr:pilus assembly protein [Bacillota bacterium]